MRRWPAPFRPGRNRFASSRHISPLSMDPRGKTYWGIPFTGPVSPPDPNRQPPGSVSRLLVDRHAQLTRRKGVSRRLCEREASGGLGVQTIPRKGGDVLHHVGGLARCTLPSLEGTPLGGYPADDP